MSPSLPRGSQQQRYDVKGRDFWLLTLFLSSFFLAHQSRRWCGSDMSFENAWKKLIYYIMLMFCTVLFKWLHVRAGLLYWLGNSWINFFLVKSVIFMVFTWNDFLFLIAEHMLVSCSSYNRFCWDQIYQWDLEDVTMLKNRLYMLSCLSASFLQLKVQ